MEANAASPAQTLPEAGWAIILKTGWQKLRRAVLHRRPRRLRISETLSLGDRRFLAVIEFNGQEFLLAGSGNSLELLARVEGGRVIPPSAAMRELPGF